MPLQFKTCIKLTAWGLWSQINQWANISSLVTLSAQTQTFPTMQNSLMLQVILLVYHTVRVSLEQSQTLREINNSLFNELKLSGSVLSLLLMEIYLGFFLRWFIFFFPFLCGCKGFLHCLAEKFFQSWECRISLKGSIKKWFHFWSFTLSRGSLHDMSASFTAMTATTLLQDGRCGYFHLPGGNLPSSRLQKILAKVRSPVRPASQMWTCWDILYVCCRINSK